MQKKNISVIFQKNWGLFLVITFLLICVIYVCCNGENIYMPVHDNLDSNIVWLKMLKDNDLFWGNGQVPFLGGVNRNYIYYSDLQVYSWLYMFFPVFYALIIGWFVRVIVAVLGFVYLWKELLKNNFSNNKNIIIICGLIFGLAPVFPAGGLSFSFVPFILTFAIKLYRTSKKKYYLYLLLSPLFSNFIFFGIFICGYFVIFFFIDLIVTKKPKWRMLIAMFLYAIGSVIVEWRLFFCAFFSNEPLIREEMIIGSSSLIGLLKNIFNGFVRGHYHSSSAHIYFILPVCFIYFSYLNISIIKSLGIKECFKKLFNWILLCILFNSIVYGLGYYEPFINLIGIIIPPLKGFQFARTLWLNNFLWCFAFSYVVITIGKKRILPYCACLIELIVMLINPEQYNIVGYNIIYQIDKSNVMSYCEFYSEGLFEEIKDDIGYNNEWSCAFGFHPAVLNYNNISTLDGYLSYYPLSYKKQFRELIAPDLEVDEKNRAYFDYVGIRPYLFSKDVSYAPEREKSVTQAELLIDSVVFKEMNGKYIFSAVEITNAETLGFEELGCYSDEESLYIIHVYEIKTISNNST